VVHQAALQFQGEVAFGAADQDRLQQLTEGLIGDLGGDPQAGDLVLVLDQPQLLDGLSEVGQAQAGCGRGDGPVPGDGQVVLLDGEAVGAEPGRELGGGHSRIAAPGREHHAADVLGGLPFGRVVRGVPAVDKETLRRSEQQHRTGRRPPRQIADVHGA